MAKLKKNDVKKLNREDLQKNLVELKKELMMLRAKASTGTAMESPGRIKSVKRNIARMITFVKLKKEEIKKK